MLADLEHPVLGPFASLLTTTGVLDGPALRHYTPPGVDAWRSSYWFW